MVASVSAHVWQNAIIIIFLNFIFLLCFMWIWWPHFWRSKLVFWCAVTAAAAGSSFYFIYYFLARFFFYVYIHSKTKREWQIFAPCKFNVFYLNLEFRSNDSGLNRSVRARAYKKKNRSSFYNIISLVRVKETTTEKVFRKC